jgi:hypothetical protein
MPSGSSAPDIIAKLLQLVRQGQCQTIQDLADEIKIGYGTCLWILTAELGMHRVAAKFVPRILTVDQKQQCVSVCEELQQISFDNAVFLSRVITDDESWIYGYDPETKPMEKSKLTETEKSETGEEQIQEYALAGQTVNTACYCDLLRQLCEKVLRFWPKLWRQKNWLLHHDNALSHTSFFPPANFFTKSYMTVDPYPPYSPDLAPCNFSLFPN